MRSPDSSTGSISDIYDLLIEYDNYIVGEHVVKIDHVLLGVPGAALSDVTDVYSHSQPLLQCRPYLNAHPEWKLHEEGSTAGCARKKGTPVRRLSQASAPGSIMGLRYWQRKSA